MRRYTMMLLILAVGAPAARPPTPKSRRARLYRRQTFGRRAVAGSALRAGVSQLRNSPHQWGHGFPGYAKRFGSSFGQHAIGNTIGFGVGALRHEDPRYYRSGRKGKWPRLKYAVTRTFIARKDNGRKTVAGGKLSGAMGGAMAAQAWQPGGFALGAGAASGGIAVGGQMAANVAREFWPHGRKHKRRRVSRAAKISSSRNQ